MRLNERNLTGEELYECDRCKIRGERKFFAVLENGGHFCLSCWLEKENSRLIQRRPISAGF